MAAPSNGGCIPVSVEFDDERQSCIEPDVVLAVGDQALGKLPTLGGSLQSMKKLLYLCNGPRRIRLVECSDQLGQILVHLLSHSYETALAPHFFNLGEACRQR